jgi:type IV pilus assembly protein PilW
LVLRYLHTEGVPVTAFAAAGTGEGMTVDAGRFDALTSDGVANPVLFGIADCNRVDVFNGTAASPSVTTAGGYGLGARYTTAPSGLTMLYRAESLVYYVAPNTAGEPALWRARADATGNYPVANREELVEGIESLQLLFGQDEVVAISSTTPPRGNITVQNTATNVTTGAINNVQRAAQWRRVGLVQVGILARSPTPAAAGQAADVDQRQRVLGLEFAPGATNDTRFRAGYEVTVALRNRLFGN